MVEVLDPPTEKQIADPIPGFEDLLSFLLYLQTPYSFFS